VPIVGDPCYRYCRIVKENFFKNYACCFLYVKAVPYLRDNMKKEMKKDPSLGLIIKEFLERANETIAMRV